MKGDAGVHEIRCLRTDDHPPHPAGPWGWCRGLDLAGPRVIFSTVHGSHLYGLATPDSDMDTFTVTDSERPRANQTIDGQDDRTMVGFNTFLIRALGGSHQSVEALFSPYKAWNPAFNHFRPFIENAVVCGSAVYEKYERTIHKFCYGDYKRRRHAVRLSQNLDGLRRDGRFNPVMTEGDKGTAEYLAEHMEGDDLWRVLTATG
jgi:hypothetical protein